MPTRLERYDGQIHLFVALPTMIDDANRALDLAGAELRSVLA